MMISCGKWRQGLDGAQAKICLENGNYDAYPGIDESHAADRGAAGGCEGPMRGTRRAHAFVAAKTCVSRFRAQIRIQKMPVGVYPSPRRNMQLLIACH